MTHTLPFVVLAVFLGGCIADTSNLVGPEGGFVQSDDGVIALDIPAGALLTEHEITVAAVASEPTDAIGTAYALTPDRLPMLIPATVTYAAEDLEPGDRLVGRRGSDWVALPDARRDDDGTYLEASLTYLTVIAPAPR